MSSFEFFSYTPPSELAPFVDAIWDAHPRLAYDAAVALTTSTKPAGDHGDT